MKLLPIFVTIPLWLMVGAYLAIGRPISAALAFACWPILEYAAHRFAMHGLEGTRLFKKIHGVHHMYPRDVRHFTIPAPVVLIVAVPLALVDRGVAGGILVAFGLYDLVHLGCHGLGPLASLTPASLIEHHRQHHRRPRTAFAVTAPIVDRAFRTSPRPRA